MGRFDKEFKTVLPKQYTTWTAFLLGVIKSVPELEKSTDTKFIKLEIDTSDGRVKPIWTTHFYSLDFIKARSAEEVINHLPTSNDMSRLMSIYAQAMRNSRADSNDTQPAVITKATELWKLRG